VYLPKGIVYVRLSTKDTFLGCMFKVVTDFNKIIPAPAVILSLKYFDVMDMSKYLLTSCLKKHPLLCHCRIYPSRTTDLYLRKVFPLGLFGIAQYCPLNVKVKGKLAPVLNQVPHHKDIHYLMKHRTRKTYLDSGDIAPRILNFGGM